MKIEEIGGQEREEHRPSNRPSRLSANQALLWVKVVNESAGKEAIKKG